MSMPSAVFLDTSILAGQQYNFGSTALATFIPAARKRAVRYLLPDPTEQEILRQIRERSVEALKALEEVRRLAPFLAKWNHYPTKYSQMIDREVAKIAQDDWKSFLANFDVQKLGYTGVDLSTIMEWYGSVRPPFGEGKKRKEFPDAFAVAILNEYVRANDCVIAVVSEDRDFKLACDRFSSLFYFKSLPALTEVLLMEDEKIEQLRKSIMADHAGALARCLIDGPNEYEFCHVIDDFQVRKSSLIHATITELRIVALGSGEATITFVADLEGEHSLEYSYHEYDEWIRETSEISCTAKVAIDLKYNTVTKIISIERDQPWRPITLKRWPADWQLL